MTLTPAINFFREVAREREESIDKDSALAISLILSRLRANLGKHRKLTRVEFVIGGNDMECLIMLDKTDRVFMIFSFGGSLFVKMYDTTARFILLETRTIPLADIDHPEKWYDVVRFILEPVNDEPDQPTGGVNP